jgi:hypothetical protein
MRIVIGTAKLVDNDVIVLMLDRIKAIDTSVQQTYLTFTYDEATAMAKEALWDVRKDADWHNAMMEEFFACKWDNVLIRIIALGGGESFHSFGGRLNNFYNSLLARITKYKEDPPPADWDGIYYQPTTPDK